MIEPYARLEPSKLKAWMQQVFQVQGVGAEHAEIVGEVLLAADLKGFDTHGLSRVGYYCARIAGGVTRTDVRMETIRETPTTAVLDAHHSLGHVAAHHAMSLAMEKASASGLGAVAVRNSTHYGIAGYYPLMAAKAGMIGLATTNARPCVVPTFGVEPLYGTNPLAFAAPSSDPFPFSYDASMATVQRGKIEIAARQSKPVPEGYVVGRDGTCLHDAAQILELFKTGQASLVPLGGLGEEHGGHKGYGLSIVLEVLSSALQTGAFLSGLAGGDAEGTWKPYRVGHFFMAMSVEAFTELDTFRDSVGRMMGELRTGERQPGQPRIWTPGEKEWETEQERRRTGIPVSRELAEEARSISDRLGIEPLPMDLA